MAKKKVKRQEREKSQEVDLLKPVDLSTVGTEDDPCFGKHHDIKAEECQMCGDSELCQIHFQQKLNIDRLAREKKTQFKDVEKKPKLSKKKVKKYYEAKLDKYNGNKGKALRLTTKKFGSDKKTIKTIIS